MSNWATEWIQVNMGRKGKSELDRNDEQQLMRAANHLCVHLNRKAHPVYDVAEFHKDKHQAA